MKKRISIAIFMALIFLLSGCSYSGGDPNLRIKKLEAIATHYALKTDEQLKVRFFTVTENGKRSEILPRDVEMYLDDSDINNVEIENGNLFTFKTAGKHSIKLRLMNEQSIKGKLEVSVYPTDEYQTMQARQMSEIHEVTLEGTEAIVPDKDAIEVYEKLKNSGMTELNFAPLLDTFKYYERDTHYSTLDLRYWVAVKILKDGKPLHPNNGFKIFYLDIDKNKCVNVFGNVIEAPAFKGVEYTSIIGDLKGEVFTGMHLSNEIDMEYAENPNQFFASKSYSFLILSEEAGRYEIFVEAILKDQNKKFALATHIIDVLGESEIVKNNGYLPQSIALD